jgi:outer membrane protein insertion porin family
MSGRVRAVAAVLVLCGVLAPAAARADVAAYLGRPVVSVRLTIEGRDSVEPELEDLVETKTGAPLSMAAVRETLKHLFSLGRFDDVRADATLAGAGVALVYELSPVHPVTRIEFAGTQDVPGVDEGRLRRAVTDRYGPAPPLGRADDAARVVADSLRQRGYLHAQVTPRAELHHDPDRATLFLSVVAGDRTRIGTITVSGAGGDDRARLLAALSLKPGDAWEPEALGQLIDDYLDRLHRRGFYEARLSESAKLADQDTVANVTLAFVRGPHVRVVFSGDPLPAPMRTELVPVEREGSVDEDLLEDSSHRIEEYLRSQGYRDAAAPFTRSETGDELTITFNVKKGPLSRVQDVEISGNAALDAEAIGARMRTRVGQPFSSDVLDSDVAALEAFYRRNGFASVSVSSAVESSPPAAAGAEIPVTVRLTVREGSRTTIASVRIDGNASVAEEVLRRDLATAPGRPYFAPEVAVDRDAMLARYANLGYPNATIVVDPGLSADGTRADIVFRVQEGPRVFVDHVLIVGNFRTSRRTILRELQFKSGDPLGPAAINDSQRRLASLGLFRRVRISELSQGDETKRDVLVSVEEAPATTIAYGGGFDVRPLTVQASDTGVASTVLRFAPRASFSISRSNLFGKRRSISLFTSVSQLLNGTASGGQAFTEYRVLGSYREPRLFDTSADAAVTAVVEQQLRTSFDFFRRGLNAEVGRRLTRDVSLSGSYQLQNVKVFNEVVSPQDKLLIDRLFPQVLLSSFSLSVIRDTRNDAIDPTRGNYLSGNGQLAAKAIGSEVGFVKTFLSAATFRSLPHAHGTVFAGDARFGMARGFPELKALPASERFFAGGSTTVRGFALDQLGTPETIDQNGFPIGGNALVIFNAELRVPVWRGLGVVGFLDTGNVWALPSDISLPQMRSAAGIGLRYKSPVGPIRIDLGFKLNRLEIVPGQRESLTALHISFGEAF